MRASQLPQVAQKGSAPCRSSWCAKGLSVLDRQEANLSILQVSHHLGASIRICGGNQYQHTMMMMMMSLPLDFLAVYCMYVSKVPLSSKEAALGHCSTASLRRTARNTEAFMVDDEVVAHVCSHAMLASKSGDSDNLVASADHVFDKE